MEYTKTVLAEANQSNSAVEPFAREEVTQAHEVLTSPEPLKIVTGRDVGWRLPVEEIDAFSIRQNNA